MPLGHLTSDVGEAGQYVAPVGSVAVTPAFPALSVQNQEEPFFSFKVTQMQALVELGLVYLLIPK